MDELEKLFQDNKSSFDRLKPSKSSWDTRSNPKSLINSDRNSWLKIAASILVLLGILFSIPAWQLYTKLEESYAKRLMFSSFMYLPLIQLTFLFT